MGHTRCGSVAERHQGGQLLPQVDVVGSVHHFVGASHPTTVQPERLGQQHQLLAVVADDTVEFPAFGPHKRQVVAHVCEVHKPRLKASESPRLVKYELDVQVRFLVHPGNGLLQHLHRLGREGLVGIAAHSMARLDRLHRGELSGRKGKERTRVELRDGHGSPFSEVTAPSIAQEKRAPLHPQHAGLVMLGDAGVVGKEDQAVGHLLSAVTPATSNIPPHSRSIPWRLPGGSR